MKEVVVVVFVGDDEGRCWSKKVGSRDSGAWTMSRCRRVSRGGRRVCRESDYHESSLQTSEGTLMIDTSHTRIMAIDSNNPTAYSSSPAFATPLHPFPPTARNAAPPPPPAFKPAVVNTILPILLPPSTLRPLAFRILKKHSLNLNAAALQSLATFIGRHCGSTWREEGTGEKVLEELAKLWKAEAGSVIVEDGQKLKTILRTLEGGMVGGRIVGANAKGLGLRRQLSSLADPPSLERKGSSSFGLAGLQVQDENGEKDEEDSSRDPRSWLKVVDAFHQPRFTYDVDKKHFLSVSAKSSMFPDPKEKTKVFRERYNIILQRLQRNSSFQAPSLSAGQKGPAARRRKEVGVAEVRSHYKLTPIANLLGRGGSSHLLLGMLVIAPTGTLALNDLSGSISLDLQHASPMAVAGDCIPYFCPGMIVLVDGIYEEDWTGTGSSGLGNTGGVGGTIGGRFVGFEIFHPAVEKRDISLGINLSNGELGGGFGWVDFLGQGSERAVGSRMKKLERRLVGPESEINDRSRKMVIISELTLDEPVTLTALRMVLEEYSAKYHPPMTFMLMGNFSSRASMAGAGTGSIEYKELFNELAAVLSDFPSLLRNSTWIFVPGDNDPWASSFSAGASTIIPREGVPEIFTNRIKRAFANAKNEAGAAGKKGEVEGEAIWTSNPTRMSLFGPAHEVVVFRDDIAGRLRRNAIRIGQSIQPDEDVTMSGANPTEDENTALPSTETQNDTQDILPSDTQMSLEDPSLPAPLATDKDSEPHAIREAKRLVLSLLPQSTLSPHPMTTRPQLWSHAPSALGLYPLPNTLILGDSGLGAFCLTFEGCHVVNAGAFVEASAGRRRRVGWVEYDAWSKRGLVREGWVG